MRVYANVGGLARAYYDANVLGFPTELNIFLNGFNKEDALCDLVNAGDGKECADEKLKGKTTVDASRSVTVKLTIIAAFQMSFDNVQCRHIIFGGSPDNGYARLLGPHVDSKKISLLEGPPFAKELAELTTRYPVMNCIAVFRKTKLVAQRAEVDMAYVQSVAPPKPIVSMPVTAASGKNVQPISETKFVLASDWNTTPSPANNRKIARNAAGHRIDVPLQCSNAEIKAMKMKKICNEFHILGHCRFGNGCTFQHGTKISKKDVEALMVVARMSSCPFGLGCSNANCILGHRCLKTPCKMGKMCFFPAVMHGVDTSIASWSD